MKASMILLIFFAFVGGVVTILSPCILPILPIVLSGSLTGGKKRPLGIVTGFILSFTFFTLFLTALVKTTGLSADALRNISVFIIAIFGVSLLLPEFQIGMEKLFSKLANLIPSNQKTSERPDFIAGLFIGVSLGLIWTSCVGPILASIIALAATSSVTADAFLITLAYSIGTSIPFLAITYGGRQLLQKNPWLVTQSARIQKTFGVFMIITAIAIYANLDRTFQNYVLTAFPQYGVGLTKIEDNATVKAQLEKLKNTSGGKSMLNTLFEANSMPAPEFIPGGQWFNSDALVMNNLRGKVVLVDFWTYTCINCIRTLPYIKTWWSKYKDHGFVIVGVHTPEFEFEKNADNVAKAIKDFGLEYPIVQDNNYATWNAYNNQYWPAKYLVNKDGKIVYTHFGEGEYDQTEKKIQDLLKESGNLNEDMPINNSEHPINARSPETYLGYERMNGIVSPERIALDQPASYSSPQNISLNTFAISGTWTIGPERAMPTKDATLTYTLDAGSVYLVIRPKTQGTKGQLRVFLDDQMVTQQNAGSDVKNGIVTVDADRLYTLVQLQTPGKHTLKLEFIDGNLELYAFTFG